VWHRSKEKALAYYWDHKQEIDTNIQRRLDYAEQMSLNAPPFPLQAKLQAIIH
jgi:hypothetical protein